MARGKGQGKNWLNRNTRMAVYARDGHRCAYCGVGNGPMGYGVGVDHVLAQARGGTNSYRNGVTACTRCNSSKGDKPLASWARDFLGIRGHDPAKVIARVRNAQKREIDRVHSRALEKDRMANKGPPPPPSAHQAHAFREVALQEKIEERHLTRLSTHGTPEQQRAATRALKENAKNAESRKRAKTYGITDAEVDAEIAKRKKLKVGTSAHTGEIPTHAGTHAESLARQRGKKGGVFVVTKSGKKRYVGKG